MSNRGIEEVIFDKLYAAQQTALPQEEFMKKKEIQDDLVLAFLEGHISSEEYEWLYDNVGKLSDGVATFATPDEFQYALTLLGFSEDEVQELYSHEIAHYLADVKSGLSPEFLIQFMRLPNGDFSAVCAIGAYFDGSESDRHKLRSTIEAPDDLSEFDRRQLGQQDH